MATQSMGSKLVKKVWNVFRSRDPTWEARQHTGPSYSYHPHINRFTPTTERTMLSTAINRIGVDVASVDFRHVIVDEEGFYQKDVKSELNELLTVQANIDQTHRAFILDYAMSLMDEGCIALVPIEYDDEPNSDGFLDITSIRVGRIVEWKPKHIRVEVWDEDSGIYRDILVEKRTTAIIENPFYSIMNAPNSIMQRLNRKLALLDVVDEISSSGKLDLIIQLPYVVKSDFKRKQANDRIKDVENQLKNGTYGIAYIDGSEKVTQLNRPVDNNLMHQVEFLTSMFYSQLGITPGILDGTADDKTMNNYLMRIVRLFVVGFIDEANRKWLTKTARDNGHRIMSFRDPFDLVPVSMIPEMVDKLGRNEVASPNELRVKIGFRPSKDKAANELRNRNISAPAGANITPAKTSNEEDQNG